MYTIYGKRRSHSTTDLYRIVDDDNDNNDKKLTSMRSFSKIGRQIRQVTTLSMIKNSIPPTPPKRTDSFVASKNALTRASSYNLRDDVHKQREDTMSRTNCHSDTLKLIERPSPRSTNFVKKLVANLERRYKDNSGNTRTSELANRRNNCLDHKNILTTSSNSITTINVTSANQPLYDFAPKWRINQLEELQEAENENDELNDHSDISTYFSDVYKHPPLIYKSGDYIPIGSNVELENTTKPTSAKRSLKNVFTSLINWKIGGKNHSKGSRDYYATRESLGEEMRVFRADTMPRLMEHAAVNSQLSDLYSFKKNATTIIERPRRDTRDFAKLINRPADHEKPSPQSIATIHPVYGSSKTAGSKSSDSYNPKYEDAILGHKQPYTTTLPRPRPPPPPPPPAPPSFDSTSTSDEHLLRPSKLRDLQKRLSEQIDFSIAAVQLRASVYDVPCSNRPTAAKPNIHEYDEPNITTHYYENIGKASYNDDKRLQCSYLSTF